MRQDRSLLICSSQLWQIVRTAGSASLRCVLILLITQLFDYSTPIETSIHTLILGVPQPPVVIFLWHFPYSFAPVYSLQLFRPGVVLPVKYPNALKDTRVTRKGVFLDKAIQVSRTQIIWM